MLLVLFFFFFQAEDGIRDLYVTGVQTCALPISHVLRREWLRNVGPEKGRFRTFVLRCLTNFVINQPRIKPTVPIDLAGAEERYAVEPSHNVSPSRLFELRWAVTLLD